MSPTEANLGLARRLLIALFALEASLLGVAFALYKAPLANATPHVRGLLAASALAAAVVGTAIFYSVRRAGRDRVRVLTLALGTNLLSIVIALAVGEVGVRALARRSPTGLSVGSIELAPRWSELVAQSRVVIDRASPLGSWEPSFLRYDPELGWTVGKSRSSGPEGLYQSSAEGLRSLRRGERLADRESRFRVALVGDSNAFSLEVPFEDSWGHALEQRLVDLDAQVLNFGVDGFGIDQMLLRYRRDVTPWRPDIVIVAFIQHDLRRTMSVYPMMSLGWPGFLVKPRFALEEGSLRRVNAPLPAPEEVLSVTRREDLPHVVWDLGFGGSNQSWRFAEGPWLLRLLTSRFPRWQPPDRRVGTAATVELNAALLDTLMREIALNESVGILVYLPSASGEGPLAMATLETARLPHVSMNACIEKVPAARRRVPSGHHYSGQGNRAIAACTEGPVRDALGRLRKASD